MLKVGIVLLVAPALLLMVVFFIDQSYVNACLDQGGSYNYQLSECDLQKNHTFIPLMVRYPVLVNVSMLLSVVGLLLCMKGLLWRPNKGLKND